MASTVINKYSIHVHISHLLACQEDKIGDEDDELRGTRFNLEGFSRSSEELPLGGSDARITSQGSNPDVLTFQVGSATKGQKASTLFSC